VKAGPESNSESRGKLLNAVCELGREAKEAKVINVETAPYFTQCKWDRVPDKIDMGF